MCLLKDCHVGVHRQRIEAPYPDLPSEWADALSKSHQELMAYQINYPGFPSPHCPHTTRGSKRQTTRPFQL